MHGEPQEAPREETEQKPAELQKDDREKTKEDAPPRPPRPERVYPPRPKR
jgi:hypothetical protein